MDADLLRRPCTVFDGTRRLVSGPLEDIVPALRVATARGAAGPLLIFDDVTGQVIDLPRPESLRAAAAVAERPRGRPRLGVVGREVTLLPRHWDWLSTQPGGASVALRRLVDAARAAGGERERQRRAREAAYVFMSAIAGDLPGFEEAARALFAGDAARFARHVASWPADVRDHATRLAFGADVEAG